MCSVSLLTLLEIQVALQVGQILGLFLHVQGLACMDPVLCLISVHSIPEALPHLNIFIEQIVHSSVLGS